MLLQIKYMKQTKVLSAGNLNKKLRFLFCSVLTYSYLRSYGSKVLPFEKIQILFGFLLTYSYFCTHETGNDIRRRLGHKAQTND